MISGYSFYLRAMGVKFCIEELLDITQLFTNKLTICVYHELQLLPYSGFFFTRGL